MVAAASPLSMTDGQREVLETLVRSHTAEVRQVLRARVLLLAAEGVSNVEIAQRCEVSRPTVLAWRRAFESDGLARFGQVAKGRGRKASIPAEKVAEIVELTLHHRPEGETHWSCRTMARKAGVSSATVQRIWSELGLKPHLTETFKLSSDPRFEEKLVDVVGLYLNPPDQAVVLCFDEKSQIQALDRTQPSLPMKKGRAGTMTHDYKRHGTTTLFAALNVLDGTVIGRNMQRHRHQEFIRFLNAVETQVPARKQIHAIVDNYATHKHPNVRQWLARHPRWTFHFMPTSASWLNAVEGFFAKLTRRRLKRGVFRSVVDLQVAINRFVAETNADPKPFVWTADPKRVLAAVKRGKQTLESLH